ncbi:efflux RND transporter periplasmic adaptor subunit [bacterium]|nr:efflux RND transporter periplasmic adaptor subunit [bacterium]
MNIKSLSQKVSALGFCLLTLSQAVIAATLETSVKVIELTPQKLEVVKEYIGHLDPLERVTIRSEASGAIEKINFEKGQLVKKGQELVHISTERLALNVEKSKSNYNLAKTNYNTQKALAAKNISLRKAELNLAQSKTDLLLAETEYAKEQKLMEKKYTTESNLDTKKNALETRKISLDKAKIELDQVRIQTDQITLQSYLNNMEVEKVNLDLAILDFDKSKVKAPFSGIIKSKSVQIGGYVSAGESLLEMMDISKVLATVNIPEKDVRFVKVGQKAKVVLDAFPGKIFTGTVKTLGLEADTSSRSFPVEVVIDNKEGSLLPGMMSRAALQTISVDNQILIPAHAVLEKNDGKVVFVEQGGKAIEKKVVVGVTVENSVQVMDGLNPGDKLIISGHQFLSDNQKINVIGTSKQYVVTTCGKECLFTEI